MSRLFVTLGRSPDASRWEAQQAQCDLFKARDPGRLVGNPRLQFKATRRLRGIAACVVLVVALALTASFGEPASAPPETFEVPTPSPQTVGPPAAKPEEDEGPENGAKLSAPRRVGGLGELTIVNGSQFDAEVKLAVPGPPLALCRHFYVRTNSRHTESQIMPGEYELYFRVGEAWRKADRRFSMTHGASRFESTLAWEETKTAEGIRYVRNEVTLHPVVGGNADDLSPGFGIRRDRIRPAFEST